MNRTIARYRKALAVPFGVIVLALVKLAFGGEVDQTAIEGAVSAIALAVLVYGVPNDDVGD